jgi:VCBS repeat-containing protein
VETVNGAPYTGRAQLQADRWYAHPGETLRIGISKPDGTRTTVAIPLTGFNDKSSLGEKVFVLDS